MQNTFGGHARPPTTETSGIGRRQRLGGRLAAAPRRMAVTTALALQRRLALSSILAALRSALPLLDEARRVREPRPWRGRGGSSPAITSSSSTSRATRAAGVEEPRRAVLLLRRHGAVPGRGQTRVWSHQRAWVRRCCTQVKESLAACNDIGLASVSPQHAVDYWITFQLASDALARH